MPTGSLSAKRAGRCCGPDRNLVGQAAYLAASFLGGNRVVFNIKGNEFSLVVAVHYNGGLIFVRFVGTHQQYDRTNAEDI